MPQQAPENPWMVQASSCAFSQVFLQVTLLSLNRHWIRGPSTGACLLCPFSNQTKLIFQEPARFCKSHCASSETSLALLYSIDEHLSSLAAGACLQHVRVKPLCIYVVLVDNPGNYLVVFGAGGGAPESVLCRMPSPSGKEAMGQD